MIRVLNTDVNGSRELSSYVSAEKFGSQSPLSRGKLKPKQASMWLAGHEIEGRENAMT